MTGCPLPGTDVAVVNFPDNIVKFLFVAPAPVTEHTIRVRKFG